MIDVASLAKRPDTRFLMLFLAILAVTFTVVALQPVNDAVVVPFTALVARLSGAVLGCARGGHHGGRLRSSVSPVSRSPSTTDATG